MYREAEIKVFKKNLLVLIWFKIAYNSTVRYQSTIASVDNNFDGHAFKETDKMGLETFIE